MLCIASLVFFPILLSLTDVAVKKESSSLRPPTPSGLVYRQWCGLWCGAIAFLAVSNTWLRTNPRLEDRSTECFAFGKRERESDGEETKVLHTSTVLAFVCLIGQARRQPAGR